MKNLDKETIEKLKESDYSFEEIQRIDKSIESHKQWKWIPLYKVMCDFYTSNEKSKCMK